MSKMSGWKQILLGMVAAALVLTASPAGLTARAQEDEKDDPAQPQIELTIPGNKVPTYEYQKAQDFVINVKNVGEAQIRDFEIRPNLQGDEEQKWPFKTDYQSYSGKIDKLGSGESSQVKFSFTERDDIATGRYTVYFSYSYQTDDNNISGSRFFYVNTTEKPKQTDAPAKDTDKSGKTDKNKDKNKDKNQTAGDSAGGDIGGDISNGGASFSGGGEESDGSVPRVIVTGFDTNPKEVRAGSDFTLIVHLKNTSKKTKVKNMLFDLTSPEEGTDEQTTAPAFLPSSGSSSIYLDGMSANGTADISIKLNAKSDLLQKPYSVELGMHYEDASSNQIEASSSLSIPVKQDARFEFSDFEISPASISVDDEANVMCNLYNLGRIKLYNVRAVFKGDCIEKEEVFVGNVESGATASIDAMVKGIAPTEGPVPVKMIMSYENEEGEVTRQKREFMLEVTEMAMDEGMDAGMMMEGEEEPQGGSRLPLIIGIAVVILAAAAAVLIVKKRRKKKRMEEEEDLLYELDGPSEDEH